MADHSAVLSVAQAANGRTGEKIGRRAWVQCPGCRMLHAFTLSNDDGTVPAGPAWEWDGNLEAPTFSPSLLCVDGPLYGEDREPLGTGICHSFVRDGRWEFLTDSSHHLSGQTVDMVPLPEWFTEARDG